MTSVDPMTIIGVRWQRSSVRNHDNGARLRIICATKPGELTHINGHQRPGLSLLPGLEFGARGRHAVWWGYTLNLSSQADSIKSEIYKRMRILYHWSDTKYRIKIVKDFDKSNYSKNK